MPGTSGSDGDKIRPVALKCNVKEIPREFKGKAKIGVRRAGKIIQLVVINNNVSVFLRRTFQFNIYLLLLIANR